MTEETAIERLNYSKPPPAYVVEEIPADEQDGGNEWRARCSIASFERLTSGHALVAAWRHYKARNDPPGMFVNVWTPSGPLPPGCQWGVVGRDGILGIELESEARAAAWAWHDRRHALAARLTLQDAWPRCLRWTDAECDQVDRYIADGEETPECFWVRLKPADLDLANYEQTGSPFDAETMWTCRACRGRPRKSQQVEREGPEHVRHAPGCKVAMSQARPSRYSKSHLRRGTEDSMDSEMEDHEVGALSEEALRDAQADARRDDERVSAIRRDLEQAEQRAQQSRARVRKLAGVSVEAFLASPHLRPEDLARERASIPSGSIRCAHWEESEPTVRLGLQLGEDGPGLWLEVSRQDLGYHALEHAPDLVSRGVADALQRQVEQAHALAGEAFTARDTLRLEVERIGRVKAAAPDTLHLALREADGEIERLRKVLNDVRDDLEEGAPMSAMARLEEVLG